MSVKSDKVRIRTGNWRHLLLVWILRRLDRHSGGVNPRFIWTSPTPEVLDAPRRMAIVLVTVRGGIPIAGCVMTPDDAWRLLDLGAECLREQHQEYSKCN